MGARAPPQSISKRKCKLFIVAPAPYGSLKVHVHGKFSTKGEWEGGARPKKNFGTVSFSSEVRMFGLSLSRWVALTARSEESSGPNE